MAVGLYQRPTTAVDVLGVAAAAWSGVWSISWFDARRPTVAAASWRDNWATAGQLILMANRSQGFGIGPGSRTS